jgi:hypothetical protein
MNAPRVGDAVVPRCLYWHAGKDNGEDGRDPEDNHDEADHINRVSKDTVWENPNVGRHDGEFGEGYGGRVREIATIEGFGDSANIVREVGEVGGEIPDVFS